MLRSRLAFVIFLAYTKITKAQEKVILGGLQSYLNLVLSTN